MTYEDELLDRFAIAAMQIENGLPDMESSAEWCWRMAIAMKQARDRICTTAKPAAEHVPPFPPIDTDSIPEKPSVIAAKRLGMEPFELGERN